MTWSPPASLVGHALELIGDAPRGTAEERYEAAAWRALLLETGPPLLTREHAPFHLTASAVVLSPDGARTCLVLHRKIKRWVQPGGHLDPGDATVAAAAAREVLEETGLATRPAPVPPRLHRHPAPCRPGVVDFHLDVQFVLLADAAAPEVSDESDDVAWWPVDALPEPQADGLRGLVEYAVTGLLAARA